MTLVYTSGYRIELITIRFDAQEGENYTSHRLCRIQSLVGRRIIGVESRASWIGTTQ